MTAKDFLLKKLKPKSGSLKMGVMNNDYAAQLMEEYVELKGVKNKIPIGEVKYTLEEAWKIIRRNSDQFVNENL